MAEIIAQGLLQYLSSKHSEWVWRSFGSIRLGIAPSEFVVTTATRQIFPDLLRSTSQEATSVKFIAESQDVEERDVSKMTS